MFSIHGEIAACFTIPPSEKYPDTSYKLQLIGEQTTRDGQIKKEMITMSIPLDIYSDLSSRVGDSIDLPIGLFASNNRLNVFYPKK